jgi:hypothetical protein
MTGGDTLNKIPKVDGGTQGGVVLVGVKIDIFEKLFYYSQGL